MNFSIDELVRKYKDKDYIEIVVELDKELNWLGKANFKRLAEHHRTDEGSIKYYHSACMDLATTVGGNMTSNFCRSEFKPIFENLVAKQQMKSSVLDYFN